MFFSYLLIGFIPLALFAMMTSVAIEDYFSNQKEMELKRQANSIATNIAKNEYLFKDIKRPMFDEDIKAKSQASGCRIIVVDKMAIVVNDSSQKEIGKTYAYEEIMQALNKHDIARMQPNKETMHIAVSILDEHKDVIGAVLLIAPVAEISTLAKDIQRNLFIMFIPMAIIIFILVFFISHLLIEPLSRLLEAVKKMSEGQLHHRIKVTGRDEFAELSTSFNDMCTKLEQVEMTRQEFVSNVSHELKTPLSSMKVLSESLLIQEDIPVNVYKEFLQDINSEVDRMTNIVNELLTLVKLDRIEDALNVHSVRVNKMVEDILKRLYPLAEQKNIELLYEDVKTVVIDGDEMKLSLAISNLVENGIKYTDENGTVKVIVDSDHQNCFITVQDTGIGIVDDDQSKVFTRFYRVDKTRDRDTGGTGLGLAITHKTVLLHNGSIRLSSKLEEGSTFIVRLPIHQPETEE